MILFERVLGQTEFVYLLGWSVYSNGKKMTNWPSSGKGSSRSLTIGKPERNSDATQGATLQYIRERRLLSTDSGPSLWFGRWFKPPWWLLEGKPLN